MKKFMVTFFLLFIFIIPRITFLTPDKNISAIENKILQQLPDLSLDNILSKRFIKNFDKYVSDQFTLKVGFIKVKNIYSYLIGSREFRNVYLSKYNRLLEKFSFNKNICNSNIKNISKVVRYLKANYSINSKLMVIPTSIAFYEDQLYEYMISDSQLKSLKYIEGKFMNLSNSNFFYSPFDIWEKNKDKYIYFNTDHHWTQLGAKLAYEDMYKNKILDPPLPVSNDFYGTYYSKTILDFIKPDTIFAYKGYSNYKLSVDFNYKYNTLYDESKLKDKNKYQYFLHGDPSIGTIEGNKNINKEILIFKDSFAHTFIPFLTLNYSKIHFIDPRYCKLDLDSYLSENNNIT